MLDLKWILENADVVKQAFENRHADISLDEIISLNDQRKKLQKEFDELRALQNQKSQEIAKLKKEKKEVQKILTDMQLVAERVKKIAPEQTEVDKTLQAILLTLPNIPHVSVPVGNSLEDNKLVREWGQKKKFDFKPKEHDALGENLGLLDFTRAAKIAGSRFAVYRGALAKLERALTHLMLTLHTTQNGYEEMIPPYLVNADTLMGTGQLPKFEADLFKTNMGYYLIPTAEVPVTNFYKQETLNFKDLPKKFCAFTPCFRSEAGSYGKDIKGLIRQHQFNKVELVKITTPESSYDELESLTQDAEKILQVLNLPYRVMTLCTGDMGFSASKTYDIEVWLPGQDAYREISSCSNCEAFQARRMNTRYKDASGKIYYVHTLNGSGLAVGRTLIAVMENYQQNDGSILIPEVLQDFMQTKAISHPSK